MHMSYYKEKFGELECFKRSVNDDLVKKLIGCCTYFETRDQHKSALNSPYFGVTPIYHTSMDIAMLFAALQADVNVISDICINSPVTQTSWYVTNDPYNHMTIYMTHRILTSQAVSEKLKYAGAMSMLKLLHYKFFTSVIWNCYPYGANEEIMAYVVNNASGKYDVSKYESWGRIIEARCEYVLSDKSIHADTLKRYDDDKGIIYVISDLQTNLRQKMVRLNTLYHEAKQANDTIGSYRTLDSVDGEKIITSKAETFNSMISGMTLQVLSPSRLLDMELVDVISSKYKEVSRELLWLILTKFSELAAYQSEHGVEKERIKVKNEKTGMKEPVILDVKVLLSEFIQKTYRYCVIDDSVNMQSKKAILMKVVNTYTSSQLNNEDILTVKRSFMYFVMDTRLTKRPATIAALSLCMIIYLLVRSFEYLD